MARAARFFFSHRSVNGSRVKHWGYKFETHTKLLSDAVPRIPAYFQSVCPDLSSELLMSQFIDRMVQSGLVPFVPDQLTVTCSEPGHGIASQVEIHSAFEVRHAYCSFTYK